MPRQFKFERKPGLQIRLVEAGKQHACICGHQQRVEILGTILAILVAGDGTARYRDRRHEIELDRVLAALEVFLRDSQMLVADIRFDRHAIDANIAYGAAAPIEYQIDWLARSGYRYFKCSAQNVGAFDQLNAKRVAEIPV